MTSNLFWRAFHWHWCVVSTVVFCCFASGSSYIWISGTFKIWNFARKSRYLCHTPRSLTQGTCWQQQHLRTQTMIDVDSAQKRNLRAWTTTSLLRILHLVLLRTDRSGTWHFSCIDLHWCHFLNVFFWVVDSVVVFCFFHACLHNLACLRGLFAVGEWFWSGGRWDVLLSVWCPGPECNMILPFKSCGACLWNP